MDNDIKYMYPNDARINNLTYAGKLIADVT